MQKQQKQSRIRIVRSGMYSTRQKIKAAIIVAITVLVYVLTMWLSVDSPRKKKRTRLLPMSAAHGAHLKYSIPARLHGHMLSRQPFPTYTKATSAQSRSG